jgi:urea transporter
MTRSFLQNDKLNEFFRGILRSYSQVFFSENYLFAIPLILVSFFDISAGFTGLISVITANSSASLLKFNKQTIAKGFYGFNSLLVGLGLGYYFEITIITIVIAVFASFFTLLVTLSIQGVLGKYYLPYLSLPFLIGIWIVVNGVGMLSGTEDNQSGVYILNQLFTIGGHPLVKLHEWWVGTVTSEFLNSYFLSLGAIFFQFNVFAGIVIAFSLFLHSRIGFLLSILGYSVAFLAYRFFGMDLTQLGYSYIGFNFILGAIAIGGYFYIPSKQSFLWAFAITPVIALVAAGLFVLLKPFNVTLLSLPFNIIILTFIYALRFRTGQSKFKEVQIQEGTPKKKLYSYQSFTKRFHNFGCIPIKLPFFGEWFVSQGNNGMFTHKGEWSDAWDFVIINSDKSQFEKKGRLPEEYYCFGQNVLSPADGVVVVVEDGIEDNNIGEVNTLKNWGNTVIIKHAEGLYSKLCHLQKGSVSVKQGDSVHCGQLLAKVGNSGRSPYPHLHFQLQPTPYIGSKTLRYPLFAFIDEGSEVKTFSYPEESHKIKAPEENQFLKRTFNLMTGTKMLWTIGTPSGKERITWEVMTNIYNVSYIYCHSTKSVAHFSNDGVHFFFTYFDGDRKSLLYQFYLAAFRIPLIYLEGNLTVDYLPVNRTFSGLRLFIHDITAPFFMYLRSRSEVLLEMTGSEFDVDCFEYKSIIAGYSFRHLVWQKQYRLTVNKNGSLSFENENLKVKAVCEPF